MALRVDNYRHKGLRNQLAEELAEKGIKDTSVLDAIRKIPRHFFLDEVFTKQAYSNTAFQIGAGQTISHPYTVAFQSELLEVKKGERVLEIGTGSGYQTSVLCELGAKVFSIERQRELYLKANRMVPELGYSARIKFGDGYKGWPTYAPFDKVIVTCGAPFLPQDLMDQLKVGGRMVIPVGEGKDQEMRLIIKGVNGEFTDEYKGVFSFVPMLKETAR